MFKNTSKKLQLCAYVFFFVHGMKITYMQLNQWTMLGFPSSMIFGMIIDIINNLVVCFILSLMVYGYGRIVKHFEDIKKHDKV